MVIVSSEAFDRIRLATRRAGAILRDAQIPFALAGGVAAWVRGGVEVDHDVDFAILPADVDRALHAFEAEGYRVERPIEGWLVKTWIDDVLVDLIYEMAGEPTAGLIERADVIDVAAIRMPVMTAGDVLAAKLKTINEQFLDFGPVLRLSRCLREQIDWDHVARQTKDSPYSVAFMTLVRELGISRDR